MAKKSERLVTAREREESEKRVAAFYVPLVVCFVAMVICLFIGLGGNSKFAIEYIPGILAVGLFSIFMMLCFIAKYLMDIREHLRKKD